MNILQRISVIIHHPAQSHIGTCRDDLHPPWRKNEVNFSSHFIYDQPLCMQYVVNILYYKAKRYHHRE